MLRMLVNLVFLLVKSFTLQCVSFLIVKIKFNLQ